MQWYEKQVSVAFGLDKEELAKTAKVDFEDHSETIQQVMWLLQLSHHVPILQTLMFLWQLVF